MPITLTLSTSGPPKRQLIELAFGEIGSAGYEFGRTPEEVNDALTRLNSLMYEWPWSKLGYIQPDYGVGEPDNPSGIPFAAMNAVSAALAARIAPMMGATLSPEAKANLAIAMSKVYALVATVPSMPYGHHSPRGLGSEHRLGIGYTSPFIEEVSGDVNTPTDDPGDLAAIVGS